MSLRSPQPDAPWEKDLFFGFSRSGGWPGDAPVFCAPIGSTIDHRETVGYGDLDTSNPLGLGRPVRLSRWSSVVVSTIIRGLGTAANGS
jgi:hypothetical protein